ncbi:hypothetical protein [Microbacterium sp. NPDC079995]|uniref:hypothetical protein n=1 Tax=unclassified Microbacterium TaxID=2609290 RepID=UPI00344BA740
MFLDASTPDDLRAAVAAKANPLVDQLLAEATDIESIAPLGQNRRLVKTFRREVDFLLRSTDIEDSHGPVPVIRLSLGGATVHARDDGLKVASESLLTECNMCHTQVSSTSSTAFLLNLGFAVGRLDFCRHCAVNAIDELGATPHMGI